MYKRQPIHTEIMVLVEETIEVLGERLLLSYYWRIRFMSEWNMYDHVRYIV